MELSTKLKIQLKNAIGASNPTNLHSLDEQRFFEFFDACLADGVEISPQIIDKNWPTETVAGLGGDPALSDTVIDQVYKLVGVWKAKK